MQQINPTQPQNEEMLNPQPKSNTLLTIVISVLGTAIVVGAGMYFVMARNNSSGNQQALEKQIEYLNKKIEILESQKQANSKDVENKEQENQDIFADWQTYTNSEYEYKIKYPKGWKFKKTSELITHFGTDEGFSGIYQTPPNNIQIFKSISDLPNNEQNLTFNEWLDYQINQDMFRNKKDIILSGISGFEFLESGIINFRSIWVEKGGNFYRILINADHAEMETINQILSTFKFLD